MDAVTAALRMRDTLLGMLRGDARPLSRQAVSTTISFARISLIVGLVFLHYQKFPNSTISPFVGADTATHPLATFVNSFLLFFFFSVVPLLSMVSGWLFFAFDTDKPLQALRQRISRRFVSLYLPLVFWNALFLGIVLLLYMRQPDDPLLPELNIHLATAGAMDYVNAIFAVTRHPIGFQFWFVRDLFVTALMSPLLWLLLRHAPLIGALFLGAAWLAGSNLFIFFRTDVLFFFYLGALLRWHRVPLHIGRKAAFSLMGFYVLLVTARTLAPTVLDLANSRPQLLTACTRAMRLAGVVACWGVFLQVARSRLGGVIARYGGLAFFLHAAHYPLLAEVKIQLWHLVPAQTDGWMIAHYLASVCVTVALGLGAGLLLAHGWPRAFALMNGGRAGLQRADSGTGTQAAGEQDLYPSPRPDVAIRPIGATQQA
jgi:hypothetical protein